MKTMAGVKTFQYFIPFICMIAVHSQHPAVAQEKVDFEARKISYGENTTGMKLGFWANHNKQQIVLQHFGKRPVARVSFRSWARLEKTKGVYDFGTFPDYKRSHLFGEDPIGCINISFSEVFGPKTTIPDFYEPRISNPETRQAAKDFLYALTQEMVKQCGEMMLAIDYEIIYNYGLYKKGNNVTALSREWSEWYVEAAEVVRNACQDMGQTGAIKLVPIVNGHPFKLELLQTGPDANQWLHDVVAASDYFGLDTYHWDPGVDVTDPSVTLRIIKYWIDNYAGDKDVIVCEHGYTSVTTHYPEIYAGSKKGKTKYAGTEEQQMQYFANLFDSLRLYNESEGKFNNRLKGFNLWCITDHKTTKGEWENYWGLIRMDGSHKPALASVVSGFRNIENDPFHSPWKTNSETDISDMINTVHIATEYQSGTNHESIKCIIRDAGAGEYSLETRVRHPGGMLVCVNDSDWLYDVEPGTGFSFDLEGLIVPGQDNEIELFFTGEKYPFTQEVEQLNIRRSNQ